MGLSILSDTLTPGLARFKALFPRRSWREILFPVARQVCVSLAFQTQPFGLGAEAQAKGIHAIDNDMLGKRHGIITILKDYMPIGTTGGTKAGRFTQAHPGYVKLYAQGGRAYAVDGSQYDPQGKQIKAYRDRFRSKSTGRIRGHPGVIREDGRVSFLGALAVSQKAYDSWRKKASRLVGFAKGGWAVCARIVGGVRGIPPWVSHQKAPGRVIDTTENENNPAVKMINDVRYIDRCLSQRQVSRALSIAADRMNKNLDYVVRSRARQAGFVVR